MNHDRPDYVTNHLAESIAAVGAFAADAAERPIRAAPRDDAAPGPEALQACYASAASRLFGRMRKISGVSGTSRSLRKSKDRK